MTALLQRHDLAILCDESRPNFVRDVRSGRMPSLRLVEKVQTYIHEHEVPEHEGASS